MIIFCYEIENYLFFQIFKQSNLSKGLDSTSVVNIFKITTMLFSFPFSSELPFLDALLSKQSTSDNQCSCVTSVFRKKTYTGLQTNYFLISFTPFKYKLGLIKTLTDRAYKISNTTQGFQNDIKNLSVILKRNLFPSWLS